MIHRKIFQYNVTDASMIENEDICLFELTHLKLSKADTILGPTFFPALLKFCLWNFDNKSYETKSFVHYRHVSALEYVLQVLLYSNKESNQRMC